MPATGELPVQLGYLVFSAASLWAIGGRLSDGLPSVDRPLTLCVAGEPARNLVVPVGTSVADVLSTVGAPPAHPSALIVAGGLMMGTRADAQFRVTKGTNALFVRPVEPRLRKPEEACTLCGSCFDVCPLGLHPIGMADRVKARRYSKGLAAHLGECFLCGACSAACPCEIPLVQYFHEGKAWLSSR
jgi:electron transport complex protein RnfC